MDGRDTKGVGSGGHTPRIAMKSDILKAGDSARRVSASEFVR